MPTILPAAQNWIERVSATLLGIWKAANNGTVLIDPQQDPITYNTLNAVAPLTMTANTAEARFDVGIEGSALIPSVPANRTAFVDAVNGNDATGELGEQTFPFLTVGAALTAVLLDPVPPSASSPALVMVWPGIYAESPLTIPGYVTVASFDGPETAAIVASDPAGVLVTGSPNAVLKGLTITGATTGHGVRQTTAGQFLVEGCIVADCDVGIGASGAGVFLRINQTTIAKRLPAPMGTGLSASAGAVLAGLNITLAGYDGRMGRGITSSGATVLLGSTIQFINAADDGIYIENGGLCNGHGVFIEGSENAIRIAVSGGNVELSDCGTLGSDAEDVLLEGAAATLVTAALLHEKQPNVAPGATWFGTRFDRTKGIVVIEGNETVGAPLRPATFSAGSGGVTADGMTALWSDLDEAGPFADKTAELSSASGSAIDLVPGLGIGSSFFLGSDVPLPGAYFDVVIAQSGGSVVPYYWDGAVWQPVPRWMTVGAIAPYASGANAQFAATGKQDQRWDGALPGDTAKVINGVSKYWYWWRVTSALTIAPRIEQVRLHTNHSRFGADGTLLHYGDSRPNRSVEMDLALWRGGASGAPNNATVAYSTNISRSTPGGFPNSLVRDLAYDWNIPPDLDTSHQPVLEIEAYPSTAGGGNALIDFFYVPIPVSAGPPLLNGTLLGEVPNTQQIAMGTTAGQTQVISYPLSLEALICGTDRVAHELQRRGNDGLDTFGGVFVVTKATLYYRAWKG